MNELQITELNGQRVLTTQQIAEGYGTKKRTIVDNFGNNKSRFKEGKHFFLLDGEELKKFKDNNENFGVVGNRAPKLYLWTEKGALLHAKSLGFITKTNGNGEHYGITTYTSRWRWTKG